MTQRFSFDLIDQPWLPCIWLDGRAESLSLRQTLQEAHRIRELAGDSPLTAVALHRLLLALLHRVYGPSSYEAWGELWEAKQWHADALSAYLERWRDRFDLFHPERPFYQAADARVRPKSVISLMHDVASGNNPVFFDHHTEAGGITLDASEAARAVVTAQCYGLSGPCDPSQKLYFTDGAAARGIHFLVEGDSLFETLMLNLLRYPDDEVMPTRDKDCPAWEMDDPFQPERETPLGYLDYLTWQNRRILLLPEGVTDNPVVRQMTWAPALRLASTVLDPFKHYRFDPDPKKGGYKALRFSEERALWRDSAPLLSLHRSLEAESRARPPRPFKWLHDLIDDDSVLFSAGRTCRFRAQGMASDQARVFFFRDERLPLPLAYLDSPDLVARLQEATDRAEAAARQLWSACRTLATFMMKPGADAPGARLPAREDLDRLTHYWAPERHYWAALELPFRRLLVDLPAAPAAATAVWHEVTRRVAWQALEETITLAGDDGWALKAAVHARGQLAAGLNRVYSLTEKEV